MKLPLSSLLLASLCALSSWSILSNGTLVLTQSPDLSIGEGETVHINCCWTGEYNRLRFMWLKDESRFNYSNESNIIEKSRPLKNESECLNLTLSNIKRKDSGRYTCSLSVEIPVYNTFKGNGTVITVITEENTAAIDGFLDHPTPNSGIIAIGVVVPLLLITLACFCVLKIRRDLAQEVRVIYEVPHTDSDTAEMEKHSTCSSTGSSHWCKVAVYESCNYFEHMQTKESG